MKRIAALVLVLAAGCLGRRPMPPATGPDAASSPGGAADPGAVIDRIAGEALARGSLAGLSIAVVRKGRVVARGKGMADVAARRPVTSETVFRIGSITKQFTAAAILVLAAEGKLAVDDRLTKFVKDVPAGAEAVTLRHLLTHTSGIKSYTELPWFHQHMAESFPRAELVQRVAREPLEFPPGTRWSYSNSNYYLLGLVVEKASGRGYAEFLHDRVLAPAGLSHTRYCPDRQDYPGAAQPYRPEGGAVVPAFPLSMEHPFAAGALCSTAEDLITWIQGLAAGKVVGAGGWKQMTTPATLADGTSVPYGFGLAVATRDGHRTIGHNGAINGFGSALALYPDDDLAVAVLANTIGPAAEQVGRRLSRALLGGTRLE